MWVRQGHVYHVKPELGVGAAKLVVRAESFLVAAPHSTAQHSDDHDSLDLAPESLGPLMASGANHTHAMS